MACVGPAATLPGLRGPVGSAGASARNNVSVFSLGGFLKRKKNFHFDFTLRYHCLWVRAPLPPGWSLGLFSSVSSWGCVPKGHHPRFSPSLPTSSRGCTGRGLAPPQHPSGFMDQKTLQHAVGWRPVLSVSVNGLKFRPGPPAAVNKCVSFLKSCVALPPRLEAGA